MGSNRICEPGSAPARFEPPGPHTLILKRALARDRESRQALVARDVLGAHAQDRVAPTRDVQCQVRLRDGLEGAPASGSATDLDAVAEERQARSALAQEQRGGDERSE